jgi:pyruvate/2-oxoglutarate dehydrogenase complex dihydrolipoamide acyltransferase (E2) component
VLDHDGSTQTVTQDATLTQTSAGAFNHGTIRQSTKQTTKTGDVQTQTGDQSAKSVQTASGSASNQLNVDQSQDQNAKDGTSQQQNASAPTLPDCAPGTFTFFPHTCSNISQSSEAGNNDAHLTQKVKESADTAAIATQQQGNFGGGVDARIHEDTVSGKQHDDANQDKRQHAKAAPGSSQTQVDPMFCCGAGSQFGGTNNKESIDQSTSQDATSADAFQESSLIGQSVTPTGTCDVKQHGRDNADATTNSVTLTPCPFVILTTQCTSGGEEEAPGCTAFTPITTPPDECIDCLAGPLAFLSRRQA